MERFTQHLRWLLASLMLTLGMSTWGADETITFSGTNGVAMETITQGDLTITWDKGSNSNAPKWYNTGSAVRCYGGNSITVTSSGSNIAEITVTFGSSDGSNEITTDVGTWTSPTWTGDASSVKFTIGGTSGNRRIQKLEVTYTAAASDAPSFTSDNVDIDYDATYGSIAYTVNNPVTGGSVSASTTADWLTLGSATSSPVSFTCTANSEAAERTATVTLTYTYGSETVTKNVTVTQAGNPDVVNNISDITAAGTYAVRGTIVAKSNRGFIVGDGTGYVYYYNTNYDQSSYNIGDKVKLTGSVSVYSGVYEFTSSATVTAATESNYVEENPTVLLGADMDSRVASTTPAQLSSYVQYEGKLSVSGTHYNIIDIDGATTAQGSISYPISTDFTSLDGQEVIVKGYYVGVSSSTYYNTMLGSIEAVAGFVAAPEFDVPEGEYDAAQEVTITCATTGASIYYTLDGTDPTTSSTVYDGTPITISTTTTLKAIASDGTNVSEITSATYTIDTRIETHIVLNNGTDYESGHTFTITVGDAFTSPEAWVTLPSGVYLNRANSHLTCTGDNDDLATVNSSTGAVTLVSGATGTINVTISYPGSENYKPCTGSYTVIVNAAITPGDALFNETFAEFSGSGGRDGSFSGSVGASSTANTDESDWTFTSCGGADQCLKFGTGSANGTFITRTITLTGDGTLTFSAAGWGDTKTNTLTVTTNDGNITLSGDTNVTLTNGEWTDYTVNITGATGSFSLTFTGKRGFIDDIKVVSATPDEHTATTTSFNAPTESFEVTLGEAFIAPTATLDPAEAGSLIYESSNPAVATVNANTGAVEILAAGTTTITAKFEGNNNYKPSQASYTITVTDPNAKGTETNPYTVAEVLEIYANGTLPTSEVYVAGIVSEIKSLDTSKYPRAQYYISDDGTTTDQFLIYNGYYLDGADFTSDDQLMVGDEVTVCGTLTTYGSTNEMAANNKIVAFNRPAAAVEAPVFSVDGGTYTEDQTVEITCATTGASIYYTLDGTEPTTASTPYTAALTISETTTLKAIASDGTNVSTVTTATYTINKVEKPYALNYGTEYYTKVTDLSQLENGDAVIIVNETGKEGVSKALSTTQKNNRPACDVEWMPWIGGSFVQLAANSTVEKFILVKDESESDVSYSFYASRGEADGYIYMAGASSNNYLKTQETKDEKAKASITLDENGNATIVFKGSGSRNTLMYNNSADLFSCYGSGQQPVQLYVERPAYVSEADQQVTVADAQDCYKTFITPYDARFDGVNDHAYIVTLSADQKEAILKEVSVVPAGTPIIYKYETAGTHPITRAISGSDVLEDVSDNVLKVSRGEVTGDGTIFVLNNVSGIGFYRLNEGKTLGMGKCYIKVEQSAGVKFIGINFDGEATGIATVDSEGNVLDGPVFNLAGQRVAVPAHGLYIVNGKKVFIK